MQRYEKVSYTLLYIYNNILKKGQKRTIYMYNDCLFSLMLYLCIAILRTELRQLRVLTERLGFFYFAVFKKSTATPER